MKVSLLWRGSMLVCLVGLMASCLQAASCQVSATVVSFGSFSPLTLDVVDSTGRITVNCTDVAGYTIALSAGNGDYSQRRLVSGTDVLEYNLYLDPAHQQIWGDGLTGDYDAVSVTTPINGQDYVHTVYGRLPLILRRGAHVGSYTDTIGIIVEY